MDENIAGFIFDVVMVMFFITALSVFMFLNPASENTVKLLESTINKDKDVMESTEYKEKYITVTGADIIANILNGLETNIMVDGNEIPVDEKPYAFDYSIIKETGIYKVTPRIGRDGLIYKVEYELE